MHLSIDVLNKYTPVTEFYVDALLKKEIKANPNKIIVLDDDPTGVQTVHDIPVYTKWDTENIHRGFLEESNVFFILTNSRGMTVEQTTQVHNEIAQNIEAVAKETGTRYVIISRSDSILRGHYPLETSILRDNFEKFSGYKVDGEILCPFFKEGGRFTIDNVHYVQYCSDLVSANETEFARDKTFGYTSETLPEYVEEKTNGEFKASDCVCISLDDIHRMDFDKIESQLMGVEGFNKVIVNAISNKDLKVFCVALYRAMSKGKIFMFRTAASFVKVFSGNHNIPYLSRDMMVTDYTTNGGIIVVGSHTNKTTEQVEHLKDLEGIEFIEMDATLVKDDAAFQAEFERCLALEEKFISEGKTVCCYTTRALITADTGDKEDELRLAVKISDAVQNLVGKLKVRPAFVIAKGGITSSDVGTKALGVVRAYVLGQAAPGIPVWQTGNRSKWPGIPYIIFPGNVGEAETLKQVTDILMNE
ncbi:MAG: four-carbon acid sugar kinase family protein [Clostridiales bacterium]|nr:four-carbon acid sugar kinase family protein [Clostridiales bacterium]MDO5140032.1 four-carbon acid sugar kinase family protein [Eubacteriales bacterium]